MIMNKYDGSVLALTYWAKIPELVETTLVSK